MLRSLRYILTSPREAATAFWKAFTGTEDLNARITDEEARMKALRFAIVLYNQAFGRLPSKLEDLCHNNHNDPSWDEPFIDWRGRDTFDDLFGFPYQYSVENDIFTLLSLGVETAKKYQAKPSASGPL